MRKKKYYKKLQGFHMNRKTGHTSYPFWQHYEDVESIGFTHNKDDIADKVRLKYNINPFDDSPCYAKTKVEKQKCNTYRKKEDYIDYRIHKDDRAIINSIILADRNKTYRKNKKRK